jgi:hypothetical protein
VNTAKRDQLRASFIRDYRPSSTMDRVRCQELADLTERLSTLKKGSAEYARVVATMTALDEALRSAKSIQPPPDVASLSTDDLITRLETLLAAAREAREAEVAAAAASVTSEDQSRSVGAIPTTPTGFVAAEKESASPTSDAVLQSTQCDHIDEERALTIRRELGWTSVHSEATNLRRRE